MKRWIGLAAILAAFAAALAAWPKPSRSPPATADAPAPIMVLSLSAQPATARFTLDGRPLGCNPCTLAEAAGSRHHLVAQAPGYLDKAADLVLDVPVHLAWTLIPQGRR